MKNGGKSLPCCCIAKALDNQSYRSNHYARPVKQTAAPCTALDLLTRGGFDHRRRSYAARDDRHQRIVLIPIEKGIAGDRMHASTVTVTSCHLVMFTHPDVVSSVISLAALGSYLVSVDAQIAC
jgi:hypothetical protein